MARPSSEVSSGDGIALTTAVLGQAIVRLYDAHLYANLLGRDEPEIETALGLAAALLGAPSRTEPQTAAGPNPP
jgi:hypothetical protein